jgi:pyrimidine-nucleoside phosphorylase
MLTAELISRKQNGDALGKDEIRQLVDGFTRGDVPDYQMAAMLMAIYFRGLTDGEGRAFLNAMIESGKRLNLDSIPGIKVDKHSTGGVGDKTSLIVAPVVAAAGVPVPMISGRALGHTGGTLDKLESIPDFRVQLDDDEFIDILRRTGCAFGAQTSELVPADRKLYALRDVTSTVAIPPLIAASILSKKIAEGTNGLVMDVKVGAGGFLKSENEARELAEMLVRWSAAEGVRTLVFGTDMERPLGRAAGNAPEVMECFDILRTGNGDARLVELCSSLGGAMLFLGGKAADMEEGRKLFVDTLRSGAGLAKMREVAAAQGSSSDAIDNFASLWNPSHRHEIHASDGGFIKRVNPHEVGMALVDLGAGRRTADEPVDHSAGVVFLKQVGDRVERGDLLATAYWTKPKNEPEGIARMQRAIEIADQPPGEDRLLRFYCDENGCRDLNQ